MPNLFKSLTFFGALCVLMTAQIGEALNCYTCSYLDGYSDKSCLENVSLVSVTNCTKKYCITVRQEAINNASKVISFLRDCQDKPTFLNTVQTDASFRMYYRACVTDLCNNSNGKSASISKPPTPTEQGENGNSNVESNGIIKGINAVGSLHNQKIVYIYAILHLMVNRILLHN